LTNRGQGFGGNAPWLSSPNHILLTLVALLTSSYWLRAKSSVEYSAKSVAVLTTIPCCCRLVTHCCASCHDDSDSSYIQLALRTCINLRHMYTQDIGKQDAQKHRYFVTQNRQRSELTIKYCLNCMNLCT